MEDNKQKWIYQTISIETIEEYISYIKKGYCVFDIKDADIPYFCEEFEHLYNETKDNADALFVHKEGDVFRMVVLIACHDVEYHATIELFGLRIRQMLARRSTHAAC